MNKKNAIILSIAILFVGTFIFGFLKYSKNEKEVENISQEIVSENKYVGQIEYIEGEVEKRTGGESGWFVAEKSEIINPGSEIRTFENSRAILTFEDGSAIRLDEDTQIKFGLNDSNINIVLTRGTIFNKVSKNETREYSVAVGEYKVIALGTHFSVENKKDGEVKILVLESEVKIQDKDNNNLENVTEGNRADIKENKVEKKELENKELEDEFIVWNMEKDELKRVVKEEEVKEEAVQETSSISLSGKKTDRGVKLTWSTKNVSAPKGFKLVKSTGKNPVYPGDSYVYLSDKGTRSYEWKIDNGKEYYFRACVYTGSGCSLYSNNVLVDTPSGDSDKSDDGDDYADKVSLSAKKDGDNVKLSWSIYGGDAPKGFKVVKSKEKNPVYPGDDYKYLSDEDTDSYTWKDLSDGKTYHFRVCVYKGGECGTYSNDVSIEI